MKFSEEIFVKNSRESKKFIFSNNEFRLKSDIELQMFTSNTPVSMTETPSEEIIDSLDIDNLRLILKAKCRTIQNLDDNTKNTKTIIRPNITKKIDHSNVNINEEADLEKNVLKDVFLGDSPVSFSSKIEKFENNVVSKKWSSNEKKIVLKFQDFEIKFKKIDVLTESKVNLMLNREFQFIDVEICNTSGSALYIDEFHFESTASKLKILKKILFYI